jgi:methionyl-tRNA formyltransferase
MGTPHFAVPILKAINDSKHEILGVYTQPPKKKNRGQKISISPIHNFSNQYNFIVKHPETLSRKEDFDFIQNLRPDIVIVVAYGKILPSELLSLKNVQFINIHASLLPKWRGAAPIQRAIMSLDNETGISIMKIVPKLDAGPILLKSKIKISKEMNCEQLSIQMSELGAKLILESLDLIESGKVRYISQNEKEATYAKKISKQETKINWNVEARTLVAKINALYPSPGTWFELNGSRIKIIKAIEIKAKGTPGEVINKNLTIACSKNAIQILELTKEGKKATMASEFLKGNKIEVGTNINNNV